MDHYHNVDTRLNIIEPIKWFCKDQDFKLKSQEMISLPQWPAFLFDDPTELLDLSAQ